MNNWKIQDYKSGTLGALPSLCMTKANFLSIYGTSYFHYWTWDVARQSKYIAIRLHESNGGWRDVPYVEYYVTLTDNKLWAMYMLDGDWVLCQQRDDLEFVNSSSQGVNQISIAAAHTGNYFSLGGLSPCYTSDEFAAMYGSGYVQRTGQFLFYEAGTLNASKTHNVSEYFYTPSDNKYWVKTQVTPNYGSAGTGGASGGSVAGGGTGTSSYTICRLNPYEDYENTGGSGTDDGDCPFDCVEQTVTETRYLSEYAGEDAIPVDLEIEETVCDTPADEVTGGKPDCNQIVAALKAMGYEVTSSTLSGLGCGCTDNRMSGLANDTGTGGESPTITVTPDMVRNALKTSCPSLDLAKLTDTSVLTAIVNNTVKYPADATKILDGAVTDLCASAPDTSFWNKNGKYIAAAGLVLLVGAFMSG